MWCAPGQSICCGQPGSGTTICLAPSFPFKRTCCPSGFVCMSDGSCCRKKNFCLDPTTGKTTCCKDNQSCINGICCDKALSDVCAVWPSFSSQQCCPKGNCLVAWSPSPYPGAPVSPTVTTCCPEVSSNSKLLGMALCFPLQPSSIREALAATHVGYICVTFH